jgi:hypothetical protein
MFARLVKLKGMNARTRGRLRARPHVADANTTYLIDAAGDGYHV